MSRKGLKLGLLAVGMSLMANAFAGLTFYERNAGIELIGTATMTFYSDKIPPINGLILQEPTAQITGQKVYFAGGILTDGDFEAVVTGTYDPNNSYSIYLPGNSSFYVIDPGPIRQRLVVEGLNNSLEGLPRFKTPDAVALNMRTGGTILDIAIQNELSQDLLLNGCTINLADNLGLGDDVIISGSGIVNFGSFNLATGQKDLIWTDTLVMTDAKNLIINGDSYLYGQWVFDGNARIVGNNNGLDLTSGATIWIKHNTTVDMFDLIIDGLGSGQIVLEDATSKLRLYNVIFNMNGNYTFTCGRMLIDGSSQFNTDHYLMRFDQNASLTVDNAVLWYNPLDTIDKNNIRFGTDYEMVPKYITLLRGGSVRKVDSLKVGPHKITTNKKLDREFIVSPLRPMIVNADPEIDGDGFAYQFALSPNTALVTIDSNQLLKYTNILLKNFPVSSPGLLIGNDATLIFGNLTTVEIGEHQTLTTTLYFEGAAILNGKGKILEIGTGGSLVLRPGSSLLIDNIGLRGISENQIRCMDNRCTVSLGDVVWEQDGDFTFTQGALFVKGLWEIVGTGTFGFQTDKTLLISRFGTMHLDERMTFSYSPPIANRDLIVCENGYSTLSINSATLMSTTTGMRFTGGRLMMDGYNYIQNPGGVAESQFIAFGNGTTAGNVNVIVGPAATFEILSGSLLYDLV